MNDAITLGNLIFERKYDEAIELGNKMLLNCESDYASACMIHINLMQSYFKDRSGNESYFDLSTHHAKQAMICGHNTGLAQERLIINLEKQGHIHKAINLCNIILSKRFSFSKHGCGSKDDFTNRKEKLMSKLSKAKDSKTDLLFAMDELELMYSNIRNKYLG